MNDLQQHYPALKEVEFTLDKPEELIEGLLQTYIPSARVTQVAVVSRLFARDSCVGLT